MASNQDIQRISERIFVQASIHDEEGAGSNALGWRRLVAERDWYDLHFFFCFSRDESRPAMTISVEDGMGSHFVEEIARTLTADEAP